MTSSGSNAPEVLQEIRSKTGRGVMGYFHPVVPEEVIYAAGFHPARLYRWYFEEPITVGDSYIQTYLCSYVRSLWDQVLKGKYPYLSGAIVPRACEAVTFLYQTWKRHKPTPFVDYINVPWRRTENTISFFAKELARVGKDLGNFAGKEITEDSLRNAIKVYNRNRELLKKVYDSRKAEIPPISGTEVFDVVMSGFIFDKEEHNKLLEQLLTEISQRPQLSKPRARILLSGGCVIDRRVWDMIESTGVSIVVDDTNNASRSFWYSVEDGAKEPLEALARAYVMVPSAFKTSIEDRFNYVSELISGYKVNGIIFAINKNCESEKFVYPELNRKIREKFNLPTLNIETDYLVDMAPLRTRVEAFIETLTA
jgi:benzoyl-CoA reductase/2-hydroxyglutaryl-CoA dehydratase subunit BcrC/BadD/HgdB